MIVERLAQITTPKVVNFEIPGHPVTIRQPRSILESQISEIVFPNGREDVEGFDDIV